MPAGNGTGPSGYGPGSGRAAGYCAGNGLPGYANPFRGGSCFGTGRGRSSRGRRNQFYATGVPGRNRDSGRHPGFYGKGYGFTVPEITKESEIKILKEQAAFMQKEISSIQNKVADLESATCEDVSGRGV